MSEETIIEEEINDDSKSVEEANNDEEKEEKEETEEIKLKHSVLIKLYLSELKNPNSVQSIISNVG